MCWSVCFGCMLKEILRVHVFMHVLVCVLMNKGCMLTVVPAMSFNYVIFCVLSKAYAHSHCCAAMHLCAFVYSRTSRVVNSVWRGDVCMCDVYA